MMKMNLKLFLLFSFAVFCALPRADAQYRNDDVWEYPQYAKSAVRYNIEIPDINGFVTLKCDLHVHSVFSDGQVWPEGVVNEAWQQGLDVIAMTDHIEYRPHADVVVADLNKSNDLAVEQGNRTGMIVIRGAEITRSKPFGHLNALFVDDVNLLKVDDPEQAVRTAKANGAIIQWNHPGWPDDKSTLYPLHQQLFEQGVITLVEVFNDVEYYPKVLDWCTQFDIAPAANSDVHQPAVMYYPDRCNRPMTLVFARERSLEGVREALEAKRTVAFWQGNMFGKAELLEPLVDKSVEVRSVRTAGDKRVFELINRSDIEFTLNWNNSDYDSPLHPHTTLRVELPKGAEVSFTNCRTSRNRCVVKVLR